MDNAATRVREVRINLFGGFRQFHDEPAISLEIEPAATVATLRRRIAELFDEDVKARELLKASAFATDQRVLGEDDRIPADQDLALLPPVCGG